MQTKLLVLMVLSVVFLLLQARLEAFALGQLSGNTTDDSELSFIEREREINKRYFGEKAEYFTDYPSVYRGNLHPIYMCPQWSTLDDTCEGLDFSDRLLQDSEIVREEDFWPNYVDNVYGTYNEPVIKNLKAMRKQQAVAQSPAVCAGAAQTNKQDSDTLQLATGGMASAQQHKADDLQAERGLVELGPAELAPQQQTHLWTLKGIQLALFGHMRENVKQLKNNNPEVQQSGADETVNNVIKSADEPVSTALEAGALAIDWFGGMPADAATRPSKRTELQQQTLWHIKSGEQAADSQIEQQQPSAKLYFGLMQYASSGELHNNEVSVVNQWLQAIQRKQPRWETTTAIGAAQRDFSHVPSTYRIEGASAPQCVAAEHALDVGSSSAELPICMADEQQRTPAQFPKATADTCKPTQLGFPYSAHMTAAHEHAFMNATYCPTNCSMPQPGNGTSYTACQSYACWSTAADQSNVWQTCYYFNDGSTMQPDYNAAERRTCAQHFQQDSCESIMLNSNKTAALSQSTHWTVPEQTGAEERRAAHIAAEDTAQPQHGTSVMDIRSEQVQAADAAALEPVFESNIETAKEEEEEEEEQAEWQAPLTQQLYPFGAPHELVAKQCSASIRSEPTSDALQQAKQFLQLHATADADAAAELPLFVHKRQQLILELFKRIDSNHDGYISHEELRHWLHYVEYLDHHELTDDVWQRLNPNNAASLSWPMYCKQVYGHIPNPMHAQPADQQIMRDQQRWRIADENCDNALNRYEFNKFLHDDYNKPLQEVLANETLQLLDTNHDQLISIDEYLSEIYAERVGDGPLPSGERIPTWFAIERENYQQYDRNGDGVLDRHEFVSSLMSTDNQYLDKRTRVLIDEADANDDNQLTFHEMLDNYVLFVGTVADIL